MLKGVLPLNAEYKYELWLAFNVVGAISLAQAGKADLLTLCITVFLFYLSYARLIL